MNGLFVTFEGVEGCGKSTQMRMLEEGLRERGVPVLATREPGGTTISEHIRDLVLSAAHSEMAPVTELLLYFAARAQHVEEKIRPALENGSVVLCDRFADSTRAYQGGGRGISVDAIQQLNQITADNLSPALTFLLDIPVALGRQRIAARGHADRIEKENSEFHARVREAFLAIAREEPGRITLLDGARDIQDLHRQILAKTTAILNNGAVKWAPRES